MSEIDKLGQSFILTGAIIASTASINKFFSVQGHLKVIGNFKSWAGTDHFMSKFIDRRNIKSSIVMNNMLDDLL
jgi:hypothetical protein